MQKSATKREEALVGLFVLVAAGLLIATVFSLNGFFSRGHVPFRAYFKNAGGLRPGAEVRYAGGPPIGRVQEVRNDPKDATRMEITFLVRPDIPVKTDSAATITSNSPLGDNFLFIVPGTNAAPRAPAGSVLKSVEYVGFSDIETQVSLLLPDASKLLVNLNNRAAELQVTVERVNDLLNRQNRENLSASFGHIRGLLEENRPALHSTINHMNDVSAKLGPLVDDFKKTVAQANEALNHLDAMLGENRTNLRESITELRKVLVSVNTLTDQLDSTLNANSENLDEIFENVRHITENLKQFTETIKARPYTLIRSSGPPARKPGQPPAKP
jgi:phospholipid/cholesterol/gamma-HCH transport system substrate-binding protein